MLDFNVLIPVYNTKPHHLLEAVFSVINQKEVGNYKILLVDDCSQDIDTLKMLEFLHQNKRGFCECHVHHLNENGGTSEALNVGHNVLSSEYIAIMGSDDISSPDRFLKQTTYLKNNPQVDVLGTQLYGFYDDDICRNAFFTTRHPASPTLANTKDNWLVNHGTVMYKNEKVKAAGGYDLQKRRAQDVDLWGRMAPNNKFANLISVCYAWRRFKTK